MASVIEISLGYTVDNIPSNKQQQPDGKEGV